MEKIYLLSFIFCVFFSKKSLACDCKTNHSIEKALETSKLVIHARVLSKEFINYSETLLPQWADSLVKWTKDKGQLLDVSAITPNVIKIKVIVIKNFKNKTGLDTLVIFTPRNGASCGFNRFELGKEYIIFNNTDIFKQEQLKGFSGYNVQLNNTFWTSRCTRTVELNQSDLDSLNLITSPIRCINPKLKHCEFYIDSITHERIYKNANFLPEFPNGQNGLIDFYLKNTHFPPLNDQCTDSTLNNQVSFIVNPNGRISRIQFRKSEVKQFEKSIVELIQKMPSWIPGKCGKNAVSHEVVLNFRFCSPLE